MSMYQLDESRPARPESVFAHVSNVITTSSLLYKTFVIYSLQHNVTLTPTIPDAMCIIFRELLKIRTVVTTGCVYHTHPHPATVHNNQRINIKYKNLRAGGSEAGVFEFCKLELEPKCQVSTG